MTKIFIDSVSLIALNNPRDQLSSWAQRHLDYLTQSNNPLICTDYIIDEAATHLLTTIKGGFYHAAILLDWMFQSDNEILIHWIDKAVFYEAVKIFRRFNKDKLWSFTDCTSYVVMKKLKISTVFTFDDHFVEMGFKLLK